MFRRTLPLSVLSPQGRATSGACARAPLAFVLLATLLVASAAGQQQAPLELERPFTPRAGHAFVAHVPAEWPSDSSAQQDSQLVLTEDGVPLGPAHALHADIEARGAGAYSHWNGSLLFSSSDGTDPNTNGRRYVAAHDGPLGLGRTSYAPLAHRNPFVLLAPQPGAPLHAPPTAPVTASASAPRTHGPRIIWWYTIDALRADMLFAERNGQRVMPTLSHLAETGAVRFERAYATSSFTKTSTASMFTGLWPGRHRVMHGLLAVWPTGAELLFDLDPRFRTLATALSEAGYDTWTHPYTLHVRPGDGLLAGFRQLGLDVHADQPMPAPPPDGRLFVYEHILGVHAPYVPSAAARERLALLAPTHVDPAGTDWFEGPLSADAVRELHEACLGEASDADERLAQRIAWLQAQGLWADTLLIVTSDHGEGFLEHGLTQHGNSLYEEGVRVPLLLRFPDGDARAALHGSSLPHRVSLADLYPTLLALTGAEPPPYELDGTSLLPILDGSETDPLARDVLLRCSFSRRAVGGGEALFITDAILTGARKAQFGYRIQTSQGGGHAFQLGDWIAELFDLHDDPAELHNLAPQQPAEFLALMARHAAGSGPLQPRGHEPQPAPAAQPPLPPAPLDDELIEQLRALGYVR